jgi:uncharacterized membrane protein
MSKNALFSTRTLIAATTAVALGGVAKAGSNDCASTGNNSCGGTSRVDADPAAWIYVPVGVCDKIVNGTTTPV